MRSRTRQRGFTLIEFLIVAAVLAAVAAIALVAFLAALDKSNQRATMADMRTISKAIETYFVDTGSVPNATGDINDLIAVLIPYQTSVVPVKDHWGTDFRFQSDANTAYTLESFGKDGVDGADITIATKTEFERDIVLSNGVFVAAPE